MMKRYFVIAAALLIIVMVAGHLRIKRTIRLEVARQTASRVQQLDELNARLDRLDNTMKRVAEKRKAARAVHESP